MGAESPPTARASATAVVFMKRMGIYLVSAAGASGRLRVPNGHPSWRIVAPCRSAFLRATVPRLPYKSPAAKALQYCSQMPLWQHGQIMVRPPSTHWGIVSPLKIGEPLGSPPARKRGSSSVGSGGVEGAAARLGGRSYVLSRVAVLFLWGLVLAPLGRSGLRAGEIMFTPDSPAGRAKPWRPSWA